MAELKLGTIYCISIDYHDEALETIRQFMNQVTKIASK